MKQELQILYSFKFSWGYEYIFLENLEEIDN